VLSTCADTAGRVPMKEASLAKESARGEGGPAKGWAGTFATLAERSPTRPSGSIDGATALHKGALLPIPEILDPCRKRPSIFISRFFWRGERINPGMRRLI
jgi:hypothetical protein